MCDMKLSQVATCGKTILTSRLL